METLAACYHVGKKIVIPLVAQCFKLYGNYPDSTLAIEDLLKKIRAG